MLAVFSGFLEPTNIYPTVHTEHVQSMQAVNEEPLTRFTRHVGVESIDFGSGINHIRQREGAGDNVYLLAL